MLSLKIFLYTEDMKKTKKILKNIAVLMLCIILAIIYSGYYKYKVAIKNKPLAQVIEPYIKDEHFVAYDDLSEEFVNAVVAVEDKRYFSRTGFDWLAFFRATLNNIRSMQLVEGGSTIPQQVAKNLYFSFEQRGLIEKVAESYLMYDLESSYSKEFILSLYASMNYYGDGHWGIYDASYSYYNIDPKDLDLAHASILAGIPNAPAAYQLSTGYDLAKQRQKKVLS